MILNLTQHTATQEQKTAGVVDLPNREDRRALSELLTFHKLPSVEELQDRAAKIVRFAHWQWFEGLRKKGQMSVMIGGAPYLMAPLQNRLTTSGVNVLYAFSERRVEETHEGDQVRKRVVFKHLGFIGATE